MKQRRFVRDVPFGGALPAVLARGTGFTSSHAGGWRLRAEGRISAPVRARPASRPWRIAARLRAIEEEAPGEGPVRASRKRPLPALPRKIGIVTSLDGAALRDIIKVLRRRHPNAHLVIRPARVQGESAAAEIARGLRAIGGSRRGRRHSAEAADRPKTSGPSTKRVVARAIAASPSL